MSPVDLVWSHFNYFIYAQTVCIRSILILSFQVKFLYLYYPTVIINFVSAGARHILKFVVFLDVTPCSLVETYGYFRGLSCLQHYSFWRWRQHDSLRLRYICTRIHGVTSHKTKICRVSATSTLGLICNISLTHQPSFLFSWQCKTFITYI